MDWSAMIPAFLITLREGVEAALVVGIVLAYLSKVGQANLNRWVYGGIVAGLLTSALIGVLLNGSLWLVDQTQQPYSAAIKPLMEAGFGLIAVGLLGWMLIWMTQQAKLLRRRIEREVGSAIATSDSAAWGIFGLIFLAVLREGFETVIFIAAQFQQGWLPVIGALLGLIGATVMGILLFKWGVQINLKRFFQVMGILLLLIIGGLFVGVLAHLDQGIIQLAQLNHQWFQFCLNRQADSCLLGPQVWDLSAILPDRSFPGIILKTLLGYRDHLYLLEAISYATLLLALGSAYFQSLNAPRSQPVSSVVAEPEP